MPVLLSEDYTYPLPELCKVQQIFDRTLLEDVEGTLKRELAKKEITGKIHPGDRVELTLEEGRFARASLLAYALPVLLLFVGLLAAAFLNFPEIWQAACALAGLGLGLLIIKILEPRLRRLRPEARPCEKKEE